MHSSDFLTDYDLGIEIDLDDTIPWDILRYRDIDEAQDKQIRSVIDAAWNTLSFQHSTKKKHRERYREVVKNHILNMIRAFMAGCCVRISRDNNNWHYIERYSRIFTTKNYVIRSLDELISHGWIEMFPGFYDHSKGQGKQTRIGPAHQLVRLLSQVPVIQTGKLGIAKASVKETIQLRQKIDDKRFRLVPYNDTSMTLRMRSDIDRYNDFLSADMAHLTLSRTDLTNMNPDHREVINQLLIDGFLCLNTHEMLNRPYLKNKVSNQPKSTSEKPKKPSLPDDSSMNLMDIASEMSDDNEATNNTLKVAERERREGNGGYPITQTPTQIDVDIQDDSSKSCSVLEGEEHKLYSAQDILRFFPRIRRFMFRIYTPKIYRVFSAKNSQFRLNGRLHGDPIQRLPKWIREKISFGRTQSIELDYKSLHPTMLYIMAGQAPPPEIYLISKHENQQSRKEHKIVLLCAINHDNPKTLHHVVSRHFYTKFGYKQGDNRLTRAYITSIYENIVNHNAPIRQFLNTGIGLKLMRKDSEIAMRIINDLIDLCIPVRCIHDSFIVPSNHQNTLHQLMVEHFKSVMKTDFEIEISGMQRTKLISLSSTTSRSPNMAQSTISIEEPLKVEIDEDADLRYFESLLPNHIEIEINPDDILTMPFTVETEMWDTIAKHHSSTL